MQKWFPPIAVIALLILVTATLYAQPVAFKPSPHIYRIQAGGCLHEPKQRVQTGFRVKSEVGIVTALHGVVGCSSITAQSGDGKLTFTKMSIDKVDVRRDVALLLSPDLARYRADGLEEVFYPTAQDFTSQLKVVGYPLGLTN